MRSSNRGFPTILVACAAALLGASPQAAAQETLTILSFGGPFQAAQRKAYMEPFAKATGVTIKEDEWGGEMAKLRAMVESKKPTWDVVDLSDGQVELACNEGLVEPLDVKLFGGKDRFLPGAVSDCAIGNTVFSLVVGYNADKYPQGGPTKVNDFWDVTRFPGPRAMRKSPRHNMEIALIADGVPPDKVYEVLGTEPGVARAFKKLDAIKPHVKVWFDPWQQAMQMLIDGEVWMSTGTNGRVSDAAKQSGKNLKVLWDGQGLGMDHWAVVKGTPKKDLAIKFIQFAEQDQQLVEFPKYINYGVPVKSAIEKIAPQLGENLPTAAANMKVAYRQSPRFWADHGDDYEVRFNTWLAK